MFLFFVNVGIKAGKQKQKKLKNPGRKHKKLEIIYILNVVTIIINGNLKKNCTPNVKQKGMATM